LGRPAAKRSYAEAKAAEKGRLQANTEHEAQTFSSKKKLMVSLKEHVGKFIDRIEPLDLAATLALTPLIHGVIANTPAMLSKVSESYGAGLPLWERFLLWGPIGTPLSMLTEQVLPSKEDVKEMEKGLASNDVYVWLISFALAYIIIKHGGQIAIALGESVKGLTGILGFFLL